MSDGNMRALYYLVVGTVLLGGSGCSAPDPAPETETASVGTVEQAVTLPPLPPLPAVPDAMRDEGGQLNTKKWFTLDPLTGDPLDANDACQKLHAEYAIPVGSSPGTVNNTYLMDFNDDNDDGDGDNRNDDYPDKSYTCDQFRRTFLNGTTTAKLNKSVKISEACRFENASVQIEASNVQFNCGYSTFDGGGTLEDGLVLKKNSDPTKDAENREDLPTISNVHISKCKFENFDRAGVFISNKYDRYNEHDQEIYKDILGRTPVAPWDSVDAPSPADELRADSPSGFYLGDISVKNTKNAAIYIHDHVQNIDINRLITRDTRQGVYMDHGSRFNTVRNSCFLQQKQPQDEGDKGPREFIAVDSSAGNTIKSNLFYENVVGAVRLYKNCSEHAEHEDHPQQFFRRQTAHKNTISSNVIVGPDSVPVDSQGETEYAGISIASRQWEHYATNDTCSDKSVGETSGGRNIYEDFAEDNQVLANVFFGPEGRAVWVRDDNNLVYGNQLYRNGIALLAAPLASFAKVGTVGDSTFGHTIVGNALIQNTVSSCCGVTSVAFAVPPSLFEFLYGSMEHTEFAGNTYLNGAVCRSPFYVQSSNVPSEVCRFGSADEPTLYFEGDMKPFTDGGRIHGSANVECTDDGWLMHYGSYCCSGDGCTKTPLAGQYVDGLP